MVFREHRRQGCSYVLACLLGPAVVRGQSWTRSEDMPALVVELAQDLATLVVDNALPSDAAVVEEAYLHQSHNKVLHARHPASAYGAAAEVAMKARMGRVSMALLMDAVSAKIAAMMVVVRCLGAVAMAILPVAVGSMEVVGGRMVAMRHHARPAELLANGRRMGASRIELQATQHAVAGLWIHTR